MNPGPLYYEGGRYRGRGREGTRRIGVMAGCANRQSLHTSLFSCSHSLSLSVLLPPYFVPYFLSPPLSHDTVSSLSLSLALTLSHTHLYLTMVYTRVLSPVPLLVINSILAHIFTLLIVPPTTLSVSLSLSPSVSLLYTLSLSLHK